MKKKLILRYVFLVLSVGMMGLIFFFSSQSGAQSSSASGSVAAWVQKVLGSFLPEGFVEWCVANLRKGAHVFLYACLGAFFSVFFFTFSCKEWLYWLLPFAVCFVYACSDELHQLFVPERVGAFTDVFIDAIGFTLSCGIANGVRRLRTKKKEEV